MILIYSGFVPDSRALEGRLEEYLRGIYLHPVGEPIAFRVCALHREQNVAPGNDAPLRHRLDFNGQVSVVFLETKRRGGQNLDDLKKKKKKSGSHAGVSRRTSLNLFML